MTIGAVLLLEPWILAMMEDCVQLCEKRAAEISERPLMICRLREKSAFRHIFSMEKETDALDLVQDVGAGLGTGGALVVPVVEGSQRAQGRRHVRSRKRGQDRLYRGLLGWRRVYNRSEREAMEKTAWSWTYMLQQRLYDYRRQLS